MLNEYSKEIVDSVVKPSVRYRPTSDTVYQGTIVISYVKGISEKLRRIGNRFGLRTIFKTKHTLRGTLMKTGPARRSSVCMVCYGMVLQGRVSPCTATSMWSIVYPL
jgi:hypothetical protein